MLFLPIISIQKIPKNYNLQHFYELHQIGNRDIPFKKQGQSLSLSQIAQEKKFYVSSEKQYQIWHALRKYFYCLILVILDEMYTINFRLKIKSRFIISLLISLKIPYSNLDIYFHFFIFQILSELLQPLWVKSGAAAAMINIIVIYHYKR